MSIIKWTPMWDPFNEMDTMIDKFAALRGVNSFAPAMDVYQTDSDIVAEISLPGIDPSKVKISIADDILTIEGKIEKKSEIDEKNYYRKEVSMGSFHRSVALPTSVNGEAAKALYEDGILKVLIPKEERAKPKTIAIEVKKK